MTEKIQRVKLEQIGTAAFEATAAEGGSLIIDGAPDIGGEGRGMRPMEVLLAAAASCSAMDVLHILRQQRQPLEQLVVEIQGVRADAVPARYTRLDLSFTVRGAVEEPKLQRAVKLAVEKYCSVVASLAPDIEVAWSARLAQPDAST
jgi:putative redox protein